MDIKCKATLIKLSLWVVLSIFDLACYGQSTLKKSILGKWEGTRKETIGGRKTMNNGQLLREIAVYEFGNDGKVIQYLFSPEHKVPYFVRGDELTIGTLKYVIEKISEREMILLDIKDGSRSDPLAFRRFFKKVK